MKTARSNRRTASLLLTAAVMMIGGQAAWATSPVVGPQNDPTPGVPILWGIEGDSGSLFSIQDYTKISQGAEASGLTMFSRLVYDSDGSGGLRTLGEHLESFVVDYTGTAYMVYNATVSRSGSHSSVASPVLMSFNVFDASTTSPNVVSVVGRIDAPGFRADRLDNITGLAIDPWTSNLFALHRVGGQSNYTVDKLLMISAIDGSVVADLGSLTGGGLKIRSAEDLVFDTSGRLFVTDNYTDQLFEVLLNESRDGIESLVMIDANQRSGLGVRSLKTEGLAYDPVNGIIVETDDNHNMFFTYNPVTGEKVVLGGLPGLTDVEGIAFMPQPPSCVDCATEPPILISDPPIPTDDPSAAIPEPATLTIGLMALGGLTMQRRTRRKPRK